VYQGKAFDCHVPETPNLSTRFRRVGRLLIYWGTRTLTHLSDLIRAHRRAVRCRWRRLTAGQQALLVLAHLRNGDTYARLAGGFGVGIATVCRYVHEVVELLAATAPTLAQVMRRVARLAYVILDGTLIPIDRISGANDRRHYSGKHKRPWGQRPGPGRSPRSVGVAITGAAWIGPRPQSRPYPQHRRCADQGSTGHLRRQGLPRRPRRGRHPRSTVATCPNACAR